MLLHSILFEYKNPFVLPILYNKPMQCATKKGDYSSETMSLKSNTPLHSSISRSRLHIFSAVLNNNIFRYNEIEYQQFKEDDKRETALQCTSQQTHRIAKLKVIFYCSCKFFSLYFLTRRRRRRRRCMFDVYVHIIAAAHTFLCLQAMVISLLLSPIHLFVSFIRIRTFMPISCSQRENELEKNE